MKQPDAMGPLERRGRWISLVIAVLIGVPAAISSAMIIVAMTRLPASTLIHHRLSTFLGPLMFNAIPIVLSLLLYRGYSWVRYYAVFSNAVYALLLFAGLIGAETLLELLLRAAGVAISVAIATILWRSKSVKAYFDHQSRARYAIPSIRK